MNAAVLGGLVEQWVWRCQMVVTQHQLRQPIDLQAEVDKLVGQAELEARKLQEGGSAFLAKVGSRLDLRAELPEPLAPGKITDPVLNAAGRAEALHALADAFAHAARRLRSIV